MTTPAAVSGMLDELRRLPYTEWVVPAESAHRAATELGDEALLWRADSCLRLAWSYCGGPSVRALPYFARMLAQLDRQPSWWTDEHTYETLWAYKQMITTALCTPDIPLTSIEDLLASMRAHYARFGETERSVLMMKYRLAHYVHGYAEADELFQAWTALPRDRMSDCVECEPTQRVDHLVAVGRWAEASAIVADVLHRPVHGCSEQPQDICAAGVESLLRTGQTDTARWAHLMGTRISGTQAHDTSLMAIQVEVAARAGEPFRALELIEARRAVKAPHVHAELFWFAACARVLTLVAAEDPDLEVEVSAHGPETASAAGARLTAAALALAARFDARNGTTAITAEVEGKLAAGPLPPLGLLASRSARVRRSRPEDLAVLVADPVAAERRRRTAIAECDDPTLYALGEAWIDAGADEDPGGAEALAAAGELDRLARAAHLRTRRDAAAAARAGRRAVRRLRDAGRTGRAAFVELCILAEDAKSSAEVLARAAALLDQVEEARDAAETVRALRVYASLLVAAGELAQAESALRRALDMMPHDPTERDQLYADVLVGLAAIPGVNADALLAEAVTDANRAGGRRARILAALAARQLERGDAAAAETVLHTIEAAAEENSIAGWATAPLASHPDAWSEADRLLVALQRLVRRATGTPEGWQALRVLADLSLEVGRALEAADLADEALELAGSPWLPAGERDAGVAHLHTLAAHANQFLDDAPRATHHARAYLSIADAGPRAWAYRMLARHHDREADWRAALEEALAEEAWEAALDTIQGAVNSVLRTHGPGPALDLLTGTEPRLAELAETPQDKDFSSGVCAQWRARTLAHQDADAATHAAYAAAIEAFDRAGDPGAAVKARAEHGGWLSEHDRLAEAEEVLGTAAAAAEGLGLEHEARWAAYTWSDVLVELDRPDDATNVRRRFGLAD